jgi:hypothetical protein
MLHALGQRVGAHAIAAAVLLITASALIWVGVGFAGYAIFLAFLPRSGAPWAAALAAAILVIGPLGWAAIVNIRAPHARARLHAPDERVTPVADENATLSLLAKVAQEKPLLALVFAGIIGASEAILHRKD